MAEEVASTTPLLESKKEEEDKQGSETVPPTKEALTPFTGFKGIFSLKSKNQNAKERFSQKA